MHAPPSAAHRPSSHGLTVPGGPASSRDSSRCVHVCACACVHGGHTCVRAAHVCVQGRDAHVCECLQTDLADCCPDHLRVAWALTGYLHGEDETCPGL